MRNRQAPRTAVLVVLALAALAVAACSSPAAATTAPGVAVSAASGAVGPYLTGPNGMTLYTLKTDSAGTSTCSDTCAKNWPPLTTTSGSAFQPGSGVTGTLASFARPDGSLQVTYNGAPLYYYGGDKAVGDTTGQGFGGKWYVAAPSGAAPAAAPSTQASGPAY